MGPQLGRSCRLGCGWALLALLALVALLARGPSRARAHGASPGPLGVLVAGEHGSRPNVVLLDEGLAVRDHGTGDFTFVCPPGGDGEAMFTAEVTGGAVLLDSAGLSTVDGAGELASHPWRPDEDSVIALASDGRHAYALTLGEKEQKVVQLSMSAHRIVWRGAPAYGALAAEAGRIMLTAVSNGRLRIGTIIDGQAAPTEQDFPTEPSVVAALPRFSGGRAFAVLLHGKSSGTDLVELIADRLVTVHRAATLISGPVPANDTLYLTENGALFRLVDTRLLPVVSTPLLTCVGAVSGTAYVCAEGSLFAIENDMLTTTVFSYAQLRGPPAGALPTCQLQFESYKLELRGAGISLGAGQDDTPGRSPPARRLDAGSPPARRLDAGSPPARRLDAGLGPANDTDAGGKSNGTAETAPTPQTSSSRRKSGCACSPLAAPASHGGALTTAATLLAAWAGRRALRRSPRQNRP